jgi:hypothetical protein
MLVLQGEGVLTPWSHGAASFISEVEQGHRYLVGVRCRLGAQENEEIAQLDTAAQWSVVGGEIADELAADLGDIVQEHIQMSTRLGLLNGSLRKLRIELLADAEHGVNVEVDATVAVLPDWNGPVMLGFNGFLERLRIGIDPGADAQAVPLIFFGTYD